MGFFDMFFKIIIMTIMVRLFFGLIRAIAMLITGAIAKRKMKKAAKNGYTGEQYQDQQAQQGSNTSRYGEPKKQPKAGSFVPNDQPTEPGYQAQETAQQAYARQQSEQRAQAQQAAAALKAAQAMASMQQQAQANQAQADAKREANTVDVEAIEVEEN